MEILFNVLDPLAEASEIVYQWQFFSVSAGILDIFRHSGML